MSAPTLPAAPRFPDLLEFPEFPAGRAGVLREMRSVQTLIDRLQARYFEGLARFARAAEEPATVPQEVALALAIGKQAAENQVELAAALATRLPRTLEAMRRGELDGFKASKIHEPTALLTDEQAREVDAVMSHRLAGKDPAGLRRSTTLAVTRIDPEGYAERCRARRAGPKNRLRRQQHGPARPHRPGHRTDRFRGPQLLPATGGPRPADPGQGSRRQTRAPLIMPGRVR